MIEAEMRITLYRPETGNTVRLYSIHDQYARDRRRHGFTVRWERSARGSRDAGAVSAQERSYTFETQEERDLRIHRLLKQRVTHGYRVLYSFLRRDEYPTFRSILTPSRQRLPKDASQSNAASDQAFQIGAAEDVEDIAGVGSRLTQDVG